MSIMICQICNKECKNIQGLSRHIYSSHKDINKEDYYKKYILPFDSTLNNGFCKLCSKPTKFIKFKYNKYCCIDCERHDGRARNGKKATETNRKNGVYTKVNREFVKRQIDSGIFYKTRKKAVETMKRNNTYKIISEKAQKTMKQNDTYKLITKKRISTMKRNKTLNSSKAENRCYDFLNNLYNVQRNYTSELYPFDCDFYIESLDLYIECNFHWTHGYHWFDPTNEDDINKLNLWKEKSVTSDYYKKAIETWTIRDINKKTIAENNKINYLVFWNESEFYNYFNERM